VSLQPPCAQNPTSPPTPTAQGFTTDVRATLSGTTLIAQFALMRDPAGLQELEWASGINIQGSTFLSPNFQVFGEGCWMDGADVPWMAQCGTNFYFSDRQVKLTTACHHGRRAIDPRYAAPSTYP